MLSQKLSIKKFISVYIIQILAWYVEPIPINLDQQLFQKLFKHHADLSHVRPVNNSTHKVDVRMGIELQQLVLVEERRQIITTKAWVRQMWVNEYLRWNPKEWGGVDQLHTDPSFIWYPDLLLYNDASENVAGGSEKFKTLIVMHANGVNEWNAPASFKSTCKMNVKYFPFDTQVCRLKFGSWAFDATKLQLKIHDAPLMTEKYVNSSTWDVIAHKREFNSISYKCCVHPFHDITFTFVLKRRPMYYLMNLVAPCVVINLIVLFSFALPAESRDRLAINITILLAVTVFLNMLGDMLPKTSDSTPILSVFFISLMAMCGFTLINMMFVHTIHHHCKRNNADETRPPPRWILKVILNCIGRCICYESRLMYQNRYNSSDEESLILRIDEHSSLRDVKLSEILRKKEKDEILIRYSQDILHELTKISNSTNKSLERKKRKKMCQTLRIELDDNLIRYTQDILNELTKINSKNTKADDQKIAEDEWIMIAKVMDRLCFLTCLTLFFVSALITFILMYQQAPVNIDLV